MSAGPLAKQVAVVTGGAQGIGAAVAARLRDMGAAVVIWDLEVGEGRDPVDIVDQAAVRAAADRLGERGADILVNSAGVAGPTAPTWEYPLDEWRRVQRVNVEGTLLCCQALVPGMMARDYGRIVNIASIAGKEGNPNASAYSASKAAVIALTKSLGKEVAETRIAVNCITPVTAETRILEQVSPEFIEYMRGKIPRGRFVRVDEIAALVGWLCSPENSFATGAVFDLSGGRATY